MVRDLDAIYLNFISGFELALGTAQALRQGFHGPIYADLHSLFLGMHHDGIRVLQPLAGPAAWFGCFDVVQLNEDEMHQLSPDPLSLSAGALGAGTSLLVVTLGPKGAAYVAAPGFDGWRSSDRAAVPSRERLIGHRPTVSTARRLRPPRPHRPRARPADRGPRSHRLRRRVRRGRLRSAAGRRQRGGRARATRPRSPRATPGCAAPAGSAATFAASCWSHDARRRGARHVRRPLVRAVRRRLRPVAAGGEDPVRCAGRPVGLALRPARHADGRARRWRRRGGSGRSSRCPPATT